MRGRPTRIPTVSASCGSPASTTGRCHTADANGPPGQPSVMPIVDRAGGSARGLRSPRPPGGSTREREQPGSELRARGGRSSILSYCGSRVVGMPRGKPSPKLAITVDPDVHARVLDAATEEGVSVSAWMTDAARRALLVRDGVAAVAEWE